jgi:hypothetical protein
VDAHVVGGFRWHVLSHEVGAYRELTVTAIDEHGKTDRARPAVVDERVHRGTDGAPSEQHVIYENDDLIVDREVQGRLADDRRVADACEVVAVQGDIEGTERDGRILVRADRVAQPDGQDVAARTDTNDGETGEFAVAFDDLVRDPRDGATNVVGPEQRGQA